MLFLLFAVNFVLGDVESSCFTVQWLIVPGQCRAFGYIQTLSSTIEPY